VSEIRVGLGLDLHRVGPRDDGADLVLGGVHFPGEPTLVGHSDADAVAHAVADAMLGAAGMGDLGAHFPNADCTLLCDRPKVAPVREAMMANLTEAAGGPVHVKATRPEGIGAFGRAEGVACHAVALLER
jgi:2C-methyl-D-erythritol 2,4-cyclodiphosphate synthase